MSMYLNEGGRRVHRLDDQQIEAFHDVACASARVRTEVA